jgi:hypothetical protein
MKNPANRKQRPLQIPRVGELWASFGRWHLIIGRALGRLQVLTINGSLHRLGTISIKNWCYVHARHARRVWPRKTRP